MVVCKCVWGKSEADKRFLRDGWKGIGWFNLPNSQKPVKYVNGNKILHVLSGRNAFMSSEVEVHIPPSPFPNYVGSAQILF